MISQETIEQIKRQVRLVEVISEVTQLKPRGNHFIGLCPFHGEKTPSFNVKDAENFYHCFGCGVSGNVITFVMEQQGLSFPDAVELLAERFNIPIKREGRQKDSRPLVDKNKLYRINHLALRFFQQSLAKSDARVKKYVASRKLSDELIKTFQIGFAPESWGDLCSFLRGEKVPDEDILRAGLARRSSKGDLYDTFRARVVFPVFLDGNRIAGFGGRLIPALVDDEAAKTAPKYLNSAETPIYEKGKILYGLPLALQYARASKELFLVEGYMDVAGLWRAGVRNVAATCGTAVTEHHFRRISNFASRVIVLFDGDSAGRAAAARSFTLFLNSGLDAEALFLPDGEDPDSISVTHGEETAAFLKSCPRVSLLECYIDSQVEKHGFKSVSEVGAASKAKIVEDVRRILSEVANDVQRAELTRQAAFRLMVEQHHLAMSTKPKVVTERGDEATLSDADGESTLGTIKPVKELPNLDKELLRVVMAKRELATTKILHDASMCDALDPATRLFIEGLDGIFQEVELTQDERRRRIGNLLREFGDSWVAHWKQTYDMLKDPLVNIDRSLEQCFRKLEWQRFDRAILEIKRALPACTEEERSRMREELVELSRRRSQAA